MSTEPSEPAQPAAKDAPPSEPPAKVSHKSFRRKYRKIMVNFEEKMNESTDYFQDEQRLIEITRRLAEQTDQLLDLLEDLNSRPQIPARLRYDLEPPEKLRAPQQATLDTYTLTTAQAALKMGRKRLRLGQMSLIEYRELENKIVANPDFKPKTSYKELQSNTAKSVIAGTDSADGSLSEGGILSSHQEEEYLRGLDYFLAGSSTTPRPHAMSIVGVRSAERSIEREKEMQLRNPVSVYNWLRKHQPQVFLQDNEIHTEKEKKSRSSKRVSTVLKQEADDEDSVTADLGITTSRGKRKREDDAGYRPKEEIAGTRGEEKIPEVLPGGRRSCPSRISHETNQSRGRR